MLHFLTTLTSSNVAQATLSLAMIAAALDAAETLVVNHDFGPRGVFHAQYRPSIPASWLVAGTQRLLESLRYPWGLLLPGASFLLTLTLLVNSEHYVTMRLVLMLVCSTGLRLLQGRHGREGAHTVLTITLCGLCWFYASSDASRFHHLALDYIALQSLVAYTASGVAKLVNRHWWGPEALVRTASMDLFQQPRWERYLRTHPGAASAASWMVLLFECGAIPLALASTWSCLLFLCAGILFHAFIALTQGLNLFLWAFLATYPAILLLNLEVHHALR